MRQYPDPGRRPFMQLADTDAWIMPTTTGRHVSRTPTRVLHEVLEQRVRVIAASPDASPERRQIARELAQALGFALEEFVDGACS